MLCLAKQTHVVREYFAFGLYSWQQLSANDCSTGVTALTMHFLDN